MTLSDLELDAYFSRIGYCGSRAPTLSVLHALTAAHSQSIPFENLSVLLGEPIDLEFGATFQKLVRARRGGYCFEQNGLFLDVLATLGFCALPISARVRVQRPRSYTPPRTHVFVRVDVAGETWLTDVGVGGLSLTSALRFQLDIEQATPHESRRITCEGDRYFHQARLGTDWADVCEFTLEEMPPIDREVANWFTSRHPESHFRSRLIVARAAAGGRRITLSNDTLTIREADGQAADQQLSSAEALLGVLRARFGLEFAPGTRFGGPGSAWPV